MSSSNSETFLNLKQESEMTQAGFIYDEEQGKLIYSKSTLPKSANLMQAGFSGRSGPLGDSEFQHTTGKVVDEQTQQERVISYYVAEVPTGATNARISLY